MSSEFIEIRCPTGPQRLLARMTIAPKVTEENLVELSCSDCTRTLRKAGKPVLRVLHRYDLAGTLVESIVVNR